MEKEINLQETSTKIEVLDFKEVDIAYTIHEAR